MLQFFNRLLMALSLLTIRILDRPSLRPRLPRTIAWKICDTRVNATHTDLILLIRAVGRSDPKATTSDIMRLRLLRGGSDDEWGAEAIQAGSWWELKRACHLGVGIRDANRVDGCACFVVICDTAVADDALRSLRGGLLTVSLGRDLLVEKGEAHRCSSTGGGCEGEYDG